MKNLGKSHDENVNPTQDPLSNHNPLTDNGMLEARRTSVLGYAVIRRRKKAESRLPHR